MALREFEGPGGHRWKAWDVTAGQIHPKTRAEDYMRDLADGWIVFERVDGAEKRRLCPYPVDWQSWSDDEVAALCARAEVVTKRLTPPLGSWKIGDTPIGPPQSSPRKPPSRDTDGAGDERPRR
ncbi:MAG TPA: hypothetical protein VFN39_01185 [Gemmatimonadaceae bacterium]|nr:hypothetical protein [Gemmatimonadaceae bacterium]